MLILLAALACAHVSPADETTAAVPAATRRGLHHDLRRQAVDAEHAGDLPLALDLAREAYVQKQTRRAMAYVRSLETRLDALGGVAVETP